MAETTDPNASVASYEPGTTITIGIDMGETAFGRSAALDAATVLRDLDQATHHFPAVERWVLTSATPTRLEFEGTVPDGEPGEPTELPQAREIDPAVLRGIQRLRGGIEL